MDKQDVWGISFFILIYVQIMYLYVLILRGQYFSLILILICIQTFLLLIYCIFQQKIHRLFAMIRIKLRQWWFLKQMKVILKDVLNIIIHRQDNEDWERVDFQVAPRESPIEVEESHVDNGVNERNDEEKETEMFFLYSLYEDHKLNDFKQRITRNKAELMENLAEKIKSRQYELEVYQKNMDMLSRTGLNTDIERIIFEIKKNISPRLYIDVGNTINDKYDTFYEIGFCIQSYVMNIIVCSDKIEYSIYRHSELISEEEERLECDEFDNRLLYKETYFSVDDFLTHLCDYGRFERHGLGILL